MWNRFRRTVFFRRIGQRWKRVMALPQLVPESRKCRRRAFECRTIAGMFRGESTRNRMLRVAADYERMAADAEAREIAEGIFQLRALVFAPKPRRAA